MNEGGRVRDDPFRAKGSSSTPETSEFAIFLRIELDGPTGAFRNFTLQEPVILLRIGAVVPEPL